VAKRFLFASIAFIGLIFPAAFVLALLVAPAQPAPLEQSGCDRNLADAYANVTVLQARMKAAHGAEACAATRLYFLEVVKARAITALCKSGPEREREAGTRPARCRCRNHQQLDRGALQLIWAAASQIIVSGFHTFAKVPCDSTTNA